MINTKTKHTPGPWHVSHDVGDGRSIAKEIAPNCGRLLPLATAHECHAWKSNQVSREEMIANAHLIASAPELLEALEYVVKYHRDNDSGEGELFGLDYVTTCIAAIRKAKGGV